MASTDTSLYPHGRVPRNVRRAQLLEIAAEAFATRGYDGLTMADIAQAAGVTKPVVYEIFGSKDGIYRALVERSADALAERTAAAVASESEPMAKLRAGGTAFFRFAADDREAFRMLYAGGAAGRFADEVTAIRVRQARLVADLLAAQAAELGNDVDSAVVDGAAHALNGAYEALAAWAVDHADLSPAALSDWIVALVGPGLMNLATNPKKETPPMTEHHRVLIAGTGFSGIGTAIRLKERGEHDFVMLEKAPDVGGTWQANTYPGCACDIPSHLYSLSYAPNPNWTRFYPRQPEIEAYLRDVVEQNGLRAHCRLGVELLEAVWDDATARWTVRTSDGDVTCDVLVSGVGGLSEPRYPDIPGLEDFEGPAFHSARWEHDADLRGKRVAVIGTGASAIQFVPEVQKLAGRVDLYQRTPPWILPRADWDIPGPMRRLMARVPAVRKAFRGAIYAGQELLAVGMTKKPDLLKPLEKRARGFIASQISDPVLREKVTPSYRIGCKRILTSNVYYEALTRPNVDVVTDGIREIRAHSVVAGDGTEREVDAIVFGTGFHVTDVPLKDRVRGRDGTLLADAWNPSMQAHQGITVAGFPNFFILLGPNTGLGHNSIIYMIEAQVDYVMSALDELAARRGAAIEVRPEAQAQFVAQVDAMSEGTVWTSGGCASWYIDASGRNSVLWPGFTFDYRRHTRQIDPAQFTVSAPRQAPEPVAA